MEKKTELLYGILGCFLLILLRYLEVYEVITITGTTWTLFNALFNFLFVVALISITCFSIYLICVAFKAIFRS